MGQIFRLTSFLNNLLNFLRVIFENMIGSTDKYNIASVDVELDVEVVIEVVVDN